MALFGNRNDPPAAPETPPADTFDAKAAFQGLDQRIGQLAELVGKAVDRPIVVQAPTAAPTVVEEPEITDAELDAAIADGKEAAPRIRQMLDQRIRREAAKLRNEVAGLQNYGTAMFTTTAERMFLASLSPEDLKLFQRYEKEVRQLVGMCEPAIQGHPDTWTTTFDTILGRHRNELRQETQEAVLRRQTEEEQARAAAMPGKSGRRGAPEPTDDDVPSIRDLAGDFPHLGDMTEEDFIKKLNRGLPPAKRYKGWDDYVARGKAVEEDLRKLREGEYDGGVGRLPSILQ